MATTITPTIVNLTAVVTKAPTASQLQQSGALVSVGGSSLTTGSYQYCGNLAAVQALLLSSGSGNYAELNHMATTFFAQGTSVGLYVLELGDETGVDAGIAALETWITNNPGVFYAYLVPAAWDFSKDEVGSVILSAGGSGYTSAPTVTFSAPSTGTTATGTAIIQNGSVVAVTITNPGSGYTSAPTVTFSGGAGTGAAGAANLVSGLDQMAAQYSNPSAKTYFFVTTSVTNVSNYASQKSVFAVVPSPTAASTEFQAAAFFYQWLANNPSTANPLGPMSYRYLYGVTPWPATGYAANIQTILTAYGNIVLVPPQGGISNSCAFKGTTMDGSQASWWYGIDWFQIQGVQALAAAVINGSNTIPPLVYNQHGINTLLATLQGVANSAVSFQCALTITLTATSFADYTTENPNDYQSGLYNGFTADVTGQNGFLTVGVALDAIQFA